MKFKVIKKSEKSRARLGWIDTENGAVATPAFVPVATQAAVKTLDSEQAQEAYCQMLICNTFWLHLRPGENIVARNGGLHGFMNWHKPLMTDSGGFQVFSLGFGKDMDLGKIANLGKVNKFFPGKGPSFAKASEGRPFHKAQDKPFDMAQGRPFDLAQGKDTVIKRGDSPEHVKITDKGVHFLSPLDGKKLFIGPKESIKIQQKLGADIIFAFDECTPPFADREYIEKSLERTHKWAEICRSIHKRGDGGQALFGIIQGSHYKDLREQSAKFISSLGFDGYGIGGDLGNDRKDMIKIIDWTIPHLEENKPRHLLGIGHPEDMEDIIKAGIDTFDCIAPTHYARHGTAFISAGPSTGLRVNKSHSTGLRTSPSTKLRTSEKLNLRQSKFLNDKKPLDPSCECWVCGEYNRSYISHLYRAGEIGAMSLLTFHNLHFFNQFVSDIREKIREGKI